MDLKIKCTCRTCGKTFNKGDEGYNEELCLRCERMLIVKDLSDEDYEELDLEESRRAQE